MVAQPSFVKIAARHHVRGLKMQFRQLHLKWTFSSNAGGFKNLSLFFVFSGLGAEEEKVKTERVE